MNISPLLLALCFVSCAAVAASPSKPFADTIYVGGEIVTVNDTAQITEALAVKNGRILAVGKESDLMALRGGNTRVVDLDGKTMIPGFIDGHGHVFNTGIQALSANLLAAPDGNVNSIAALQQELKAWAAKPENGKHGMILGFGYDDSQLKEQRHPTRQELDEVSIEVPILIYSSIGTFSHIKYKSARSSWSNGREPRSRWRKNSQRK